ncbi:hypothetical protein ACIQVK_46380 [Streptomyces sp. NPDC090493]|uniref:hypothetical protein n=1 Tax=Streptomyces sp. NPDC090493 TaxID=3365964 RepID=UPI003810B9EF
MSDKTAITASDIVRISKAYYDAVDSGDPARISNAYLAAPTTTLQFNTDEPIVTVEAVKEWSAQFCNVVTVKHTGIEVWNTPLMGDVVPVNLLPGRRASTVTVVSTALPTFSVKGKGTRVAVPSASIFTIDIESQRFVSVHNMFDLAKVYAAVSG